MKPEIAQNLSQAIESRKILITCGLGGVGKTTVAAALGIRAALQGKKVAVITIDPAKRLATSLGLDHLQSTPTDLTPLLKKVIQEKKQDLKETHPLGQFFALMPKSEESFKRLIHSLTDQPQVIQKIFNNPILKTFSQEFSGANEYLSLEELDSLHSKNQFDLIILDTPPSRNTVSFLEAPRLLSQFFEERLIRWLVLPTHKIFATGMRKMFSILEKLTGSGFMNSLFDFGEALFSVQDRFLEKLKKVNQLLQSPDVTFLLVLSATSESHSGSSYSEINHFLTQISRQGFHFDGMIMNRSLFMLEDSEPSTTEPGVKILKTLKEQEGKSIGTLTQNQPSHLFFLKLPELSKDICTLGDLYELAKIME